jgi:two-component system sensor histidine kinase PilS (NtrC family)
MSGQTAHTEQKDLRNLCRIMIILRMICVGAALSVMAFLSAAGLEIRALYPIAGLLLVVFPLSAIWWLVLKSGYGFRTLVYSQLIADVVIESGIVYFTGGVQSHLTVLYLITIFLGGIFLWSRGAVLVATLSALLFAGFSVVELFHLRVFDGTSTGQNAVTYLVLNTILQVAFFYLIAILSGYSSRRIRAFATKLRSTTTELERARLDTRLIIESMNSGLVTVGSDKVINEFNKSAGRILGVEPEDARRRNVDEVLGPVSAELCRKISDAIDRGIEEERGEVVAATADGRRIPLGIGISLLSADRGDSTGAVLVFQDLTDVKSLAERVRLADRLAALGELSAAIAHEIRTPLASICGSIEMLRDSLVPEGEDRKLVDLVIKESERLRRKIDYFLEFARSRPSRFGEVSLDSILKDVVCLVRNHPHFGDETKVELETSSTACAWADEQTIRQVFYNLALNAVEALGSEGTLRVRLETFLDNGDGRYAKVVFEDDGTGIEDGDLERIFEPFFTRKEAGTGLGLAIASKIVEDHGGRIEIKSTKGLGTVATVYLPLDRVTVEGNYFGAGTSHRLAEPIDIRVE